MSAITVLFILLLLQTKHLIIDWIWQLPYEYENKGIWLHPGGIIHSGKQAIGDLVIFLFFFSPVVCMLLALLEFVIHYAMDYYKVNINKSKGWGPSTHAQFWWLTGFDQYIHQLTFLLLILIGISI